jgi:hypothetical protein
MGYFRNFPKLPKVNNHTMGENSPNLVTLILSRKGIFAKFCVFYKNIWKIETSVP